MFNIQSHFKKTEAQDNENCNFTSSYVQVWNVVCWFNVMKQSIYEIICTKEMYDEIFRILQNKEATDLHSSTSNVSTESVRYNGLGLWVNWVHDKYT